MELQNIKNKNTIGTEEYIADVIAEWNTFCHEFFHEFNSNLSTNDKKENRLIYYNTYISFCERFLACKDITIEQKTEYIRMMSNAQEDLNNWEKA